MSYYRSKAFNHIREKEEFMSINKVIIVGRLTKDPELKQTPSGSNVCNFSVATSDVWYDKATKQKQESTEFHNIVAWGSSAEFVSKYVNKGRQVYIEGKLQTRKWEDKDGNNRYTTEIKADKIEALGSKPSDSTAQAKDYKPSAQSDFTADEIPF